MRLIKQHLEKEKAKDKKDLRLINDLTKLLDKGEITFDQWYESGRFIHRDEFANDNPDENLHVDCTDVVVYYGGLYLQVLKSGEFYLNPKNISNNINDIEKSIWEDNCGYLCG